MSLPEGESAETWVEAMAMAGLEPGPEGEGPWVRLEQTPGPWSLVVCDAFGTVHEVEVPAPAGRADREGVVWLAASLLQSGSPPAPEPPPVAAPAPPPEPPPELEPEPPPPPPEPVAVLPPEPEVPGPSNLEVARAILEDPVPPPEPLPIDLEPVDPETEVEVVEDRPELPSLGLTPWLEVGAAAGLRPGRSLSAQLSVAGGAEGGAWRAGASVWRGTGGEPPTRDAGVELVIGWRPVQGATAGVRLLAGAGLCWRSPMFRDEVVDLGRRPTAALGVGLPVALGPVVLEPRITLRTELVAGEGVSPVEALAGLAGTLSRPE